MPAASGDATAGCQQSRAFQRTRGDFGPRVQDSARRIAHRLDRGDPVVEERPELSGEFVLLEGPHRVGTGHRAYVIEVDMRVDQARHHPPFGRVHLLSAVERFGRDGPDLSAVDGDVLQTGERPVAVEDVGAPDHQVVGHRVPGLGVHDRSGFLRRRPTAERLTSFTSGDSVCLPVWTAVGDLEVRGCSRETAAQSPRASLRLSRQWCPVSFASLRPPMPRSSPSGPVAAGGRPLEPALPRPASRRPRSPPHRTGITRLVLSGRGPWMSVLRSILVPRRHPGTAKRGEQHG